MPRWAICRCGEGGSISVQGAGEKSRTIGRGMRVDLDDVVIPGQTLGDALGKYLALFEVEEARTSRIMESFVEPESLHSLD